MMSDKHNIVMDEKAAERLAAAVEVLAARAEDLGRKNWLSIEEAAEYIGASPKYIRSKISKGQLELCGEPRKYRIHRPQLDEQMARRWPRLDVESTEEAVARVLGARPVSEHLSRPKRPKPARGACKPLVFK